MTPVLEFIASILRYDNLPNVWRDVGAAAFSRGKKLYEYQQGFALSDAA